MNKLMLASLSLLLVGATALPVQAQNRSERDASGQPGQIGTSDSERAERGEGREGRREGRREDRQERGDQRRDAGRDQRGDRGEYQADGSRRPTVQPGLAANVQQLRDSRGQDRRGDRRDDRYGRNDNRYEGRNGNRYDGRNDNRYDNRYDGRNDNRYQAGRYDVSRYSRHDDRRWNGNHWYPQYRYRAPSRYVYPRGYRANQWRVGYRLPSSYYGSNYYVDYNAYRLPPPPYGYRWVRVDRDVVLVAIASGLIRDILYGLYY